MSVTDYRIVYYSFINTYNLTDISNVAASSTARQQPMNSL